MDRPRGWTIGSYLGQPRYGCSKVAYKSRGAAEAHIRHLQRAEKDWAALGPIEPYRCSRCGAWHVGHNRRLKP